MFCIVTTTIKDPSDRPIPGAIVYFTLDKGSYTIDAQYPSGTIRIEANAQGEISADLWIDSTGLVPTNWVVRLPSGGNWRFSIPANTPTATLESLLRLGMAPPLPSAIDAAIAIHNADPLSHPSLGGGGSSLLPPYTASGALSALRIVRLGGSGLEYFSATDSSHSQSALGLLPTAVASGGSIIPIRLGQIEDQAWNWVANLPVYAGANGALTQSIAGLLLIQQIATVISPTKIFIDIQPEIKIQ